MYLGTPYEKPKGLKRLISKPLSIIASVFLAIGLGLFGSGCGSDSDGNPGGNVPTETVTDVPGIDWAQWSTQTDPETDRSFRCLTLYEEGYREAGLAVFCYEADSVSTSGFEE